MVATPALFPNVAERDVLPLFSVKSTHEGEWLEAFLGTGFVLAGKVFVTCWHCVKAAVEAGHVVLAAHQRMGRWGLNQL